MPDYEFVDRIVEHPGRVEIEPVSGAGWTTADITDGVLTLDDVSGTSFVADISREEGTVTEAGTALTATNLNTIIPGMIEELKPGNVITRKFMSNDAGVVVPFGGFALIAWAFGATTTCGIDLVFYTGSNRYTINLAKTGSDLLVEYVMYNNTPGEYELRIVASTVGSGVTDKAVRIFMVDGPGVS